MSAYRWQSQVSMLFGHCKMPNCSANVVFLWVKFRPPQIMMLHNEPFHRPIEIHFDTQNSHATAVWITAFA